MSVSIREFKAHLSRYLARVRAGETLEITSHRKVIARVMAAADKEAKGIPRLLASGAARWDGRKPAGSAIRLADTGTPLSSMVMEDRG
ncbi:type II toxin-antitoxin system prevent-host-death family antitoxin [Thiohalophilus sp.]|uniref:type II toxin-antitoxin system Phd/YefM family antitoxin n=1 Tax=Thiohalophilus sp. TaxID=3028392 RepID=UPI002ACF0926|nr:type II toxin-antitoxin system prevent-host-death family antitoxin [Thiohalophilus sp.]MDZ7662777.1 type II toxin-antitoxin system prevent-host-death family antitoxin [Thiohalophilus sp.]